jgi:hypothetical protein
VKKDAVPDTTTPEHKSTNPEAGISYTKLGHETEK